MKDRSLHQRASKGVGHQPQATATGTAAVAASCHWSCSESRQLQHHGCPLVGRAQQQPTCLSRGCWCSSWNAAVVVAVAAIAAACGIIATHNSAIASWCKGSAVGGHSRRGGIAAASGAAPTVAAATASQHSSWQQSQDVSQTGQRGA